MKKHLIYAFTAATAIAITTAHPVTAMAAGWTYGSNCTQGNLITIYPNQSGQQNCPSQSGQIIRPNKPGQTAKPEQSTKPGQTTKPEQSVKPEQSTKPEQPDQSGSNGSQNTQNAWINEVVELVNEERAKAGLSALTVHTGAASAAQVRAKELATSFSHTRPDGSNFSTALKEAGVNYSGVGENIAYGQQSPQAVMEQWMNSSGHRANILNPDFTSIGVGHYKNANGVNYWTQLFIR